jgi:putative ABC transport system permease protein
MFRGVRKTISRFLAITSIVALGVGFLGGLMATTPDMQLTFDKYYDDYKVSDLDIKGPLGITDDDVSAVSSLDCVESVLPAKVTDVNLSDGTETYVTRIYGLSELSDDKSSVNSFKLVSGRMPQNDTECVIASPNGYFSSHSVGEKYVLSDDNNDASSLSDTYSFSELTVVGIVQSPLYVSVESEPSTVGTGRVGIIMFVYDSCYSLDVYTDIFVRLKDAASLDTFSTEYTDLVDSDTEYVKSLGTDRTAVRYSDLYTDAQKKLQDASDEYDKAKKDADSQLSDAYQSIQDGKKQLDDAQSELDSKKSEIADAQQEIADNQKKLDDSILQSKASLYDSLDSLVSQQYNALYDKIENSRKSAQAEIDSAKSDLDTKSASLAQNKADLEANEQSLASMRAKLEASGKDLEQWKQSLDTQQQDIDSKRAALADEIKQDLANLENQKSSLTEEEYNSQLEQINKYNSDHTAELDSQQAALDPEKAKYTASKDEYSKNMDSLTQSEAGLAAGKQQLSEAESALSDGYSQIASKQNELDTRIQDSIDQLNTSVPQIRSAILENGLSQIESARVESQSEIDSAKEKIESAEKEIQDAESELSRKKQELEDAEKKYNDSKSDTEQKLSDAKKKIDDGQKDLDSLKSEDWVILDRNDTVSYKSYKSNTDKVAAVAKVFPVFFFLVAALVALTTMTRMVEEERTQIGTLKALGYSKGRILFYYVSYAVAASLIGSIIGITIGYNTLPYVIANAYSMMYTLPPTILKFWWSYTLVIVPLAIACTAVAAMSACLSELSEKPALLILPKAPKSGKRILLEYITPVWKRLSFIKKITARNIFRYKKRFYMTVFGIAGCCALLVTGFGIRDSVHDIVRIQFNDLYKYNVSITLKSDITSSEMDDITSLLDDDSLFSSYSMIHSEKLKIDDKEVTLFVPENNDDFVRQLVIRERKTGRTIEFNDNSVILTEKLCETCGINIGDSFTFSDSDGKEYSLKVTGIAENYISSYMFISNSTYRSVFGTAADTNAVLAHAEKDSTDEERNSLSSRLLSLNGISYLVFSESIKNSFSNTVSSIDYIVIVLIICAGGLAVIVLYNLTNINICERKKELATIKVLGFYKKEVASYIYRETTILSIIGMLLGLVLGIFLHAYVVQCAEVDAVMFGRTIYPMSFVISGAITMIFTVIVELIMLRNLSSIDMVESMKAND